MSSDTVAVVPWFEGPPEAVAPGVHRLPMPLPGDGLRAVNVYALVHDDRVTLIDAGWAVEHSLAHLEGMLATVGHGLDQVERILVTHMHRDHYTLAVRVRQLFGTRIEVGAGERESLERLSAGEFAGQLSLLRTWGAEGLLADLDRDPQADLYELPDGWIQGDTELEVGSRRLRALATPGHTQGHLVFADLDAGLLFSGDHVLPTITPSLGFESVRAAQPLGDFLDSLSLVAALPDLTVLPAHGAAGVSSHGRVSELTDHHAARLERTRDALRGGVESAYDVAGVLAWTRHERSFEELDATNQLLAVGETAAHLDLLAREGAVVRQVDSRGRAVYTPGKQPAESGTTTQGET